MKTTKKLILTAAIAAAVSLNESGRADDLFGAATKASVLANRPVGASPHALEEFSWLLRPGLNEEGAPARSNFVPAFVLKNKAFVKSPRVLEEYPMLLPRGENTSGAGTTGGNPFLVPTELLKHEAWARSPRVLEVYPWLANLDWHSPKPGRTVAENRH